MAKVRNVNVRFTGNVKDVFVKHDKVRSYLRKIERDNERVRKSQKGWLAGFTKVKTGAAALGKTISSAVLSALRAVADMIKRIATEFYQFAKGVAKESYAIARDVWQASGRIGIRFEKQFSAPNNQLRLLRKQAEDLSDLWGKPTAEIMKGADALARYPALLPHINEALTASVQYADAFNISVEQAAEQLSTAVASGRGLRRFLLQMGVHGEEVRRIMEDVNRYGVDSALPKLFAMINEEFGGMAGRTKDWQDQLETLWSNFQLQLGESFQPILQDLTKTIMNIVNTLSKSNAASRDWGKTFFHMYMIVKKIALFVGQFVSNLVWGVSKLTRFFLSVPGGMIGIFGITNEDLENFRDALKDIEDASSDITKILRWEGEKAGATRYEDIVNELKEAGTLRPNRSIQYTSAQIEVMEATRDLHEEVKALFDTRTKEEKLLERLGDIRQKAIVQGLREEQRELNEMIGTVQRYIQTEKQREMMEERRKELEESRSFFNQFMTDKEKAQQEIQELNKHIKTLGMSFLDPRALTALDQIVGQYASSLKSFADIQSEFSPVLRGSQEAYQAIYGRKTDGMPKLIGIAEKQLGLDEQIVMALQDIRRNTAKQKLEVLGE